MNPTIGSPGSGEQHLAKRTSTSSSPATLMPADCRRLTTRRISDSTGFSLVGAGLFELDRRAIEVAALLHLVEDQAVAAQLALEQLPPERLRALALLGP